MTDAKFRLYGRKGSGSLAVQIVLEETGAPYELHWVGSTPQALEGLRRVNPAGKVPALVLPDGTAVSESAALLIYLSTAFPAARLAPPAGTSAHARYLQWMVFLSANVYESALRYFYAERYSSAAAQGAPAIQARALEEYTRHLETLAATLSPYVLGETYSAADPYLYTLAGWHPQLPALQQRLPALARHAELLRQRAATRRAEEDHAE
ncbi:MAG TPA: glutathione S-transferase family protein [Steroidobacteraceae bacterium]|nr:glutathione S-transferase family protein [Steroidobacteraceae bacterium]